MTYRFPRILLTCLVVLICYTSAKSSQSVCPDDLRKTLKLTILYMNDPHAHYSPESKKDESGFTGGFAKAQSLIEQIRKANTSEGRHTIFLLAGDLLTGTSYSTIFRGSMGVELLNAMSLTAMVVGNHEFDYGIDNLTKNLRPRMNFPLLSANILDDHGHLLFQKSTMMSFENNLNSVIIFGLTTPQTPVMSSPKNVSHLTFEDPVLSANKELSEIAPNCLVVALTHLGLKMDKLLAASSPGINVIIGGHSHTRVETPIKVGETIICQAGAYAELLGRLDVDFRDGKILSYTGKLIPLETTVSEDERIRSLIEKYKESMSPELERTLGYNEAQLDASRRDVRSDAPNKLAILIAGLVADSVGADLGLVNSGSIRAGMEKGKVTLNDIYKILPFDDTVVKLQINGADLEAVLQTSAQLPDGSGGKLQSYGIVTRRVGDSIELLKVKGRPFEASENYSIAVGEFLASGGDGYEILRYKGKNKLDSGLVIRDLLVHFVETKQTVTEKDVPAVSANW